MTTNRRLTPRTRRRSSTDPSSSHARGRQRRVRARAQRIAIIMIALGVLAGVLWSANENDASTEGASAPKEVSRRQQAETTPTQPADRQDNDGTRAPGEVPGKTTLTLSGPHVTFGSHASATFPCEKCHPGSPEAGALVCRDCHGYKCGKKSKTVADCLKCHKTGTTADWIR